MDLESILERDDIPFDIKEILIKEIEKNNMLMLSWNEEKYKFLDMSQKYKDLFEGSPNLNVIVDLFGNILNCNDKIEEITGFPKEEVIGKNFTEIGVVTEEDLSQYMELLKQILEKSGKNYLNVRVIHKNDIPHYLNELKLLVVPSYILMRDNEAYAIQVIGTDITEFKNKEEELSLWKECIDSANMGIGLTDIEGKLIYVNESSVRMWGYDDDKEIVGRHLSDFWYGEGIYNTMKELLEVGRCSGEGIGRKKDGAQFTIQFSAQMIEDEFGKPQYMFGSYLDITKRKITEIALIQSEERYRSFVENFQGIAYRGRMDFTPIFFHGNVEKITGFIESEFTNGKLKWIEVVHPDDLGIIYETSQNLETVIGCSLDREYRIIKRNGNISWVFERIQNIANEKGKITGVQGTIYDITYRKEVEAALRKSETTYRMLVEKMEEGVLLEDSEGNIKFANPRTLKMLGYSEEELIGRHHSLLITEAEKENVIMETRNRPEGIGNIYESMALTKEGRQIPVLITATPIFSSENKFEGVLAVFTDITEMIKLEKQREELIMKQNEFIDQTSHEIKTPLTIIRGYTEFLMKNISKEQNIKMLETILSNCQRLETLSKGVGDLYKLERGKFDVYLTKIDFLEFLFTSLNPFIQLYPGQIHIEAEDNGPLMIQGDSTRLFTVVNNIIDNCIKNTSKKKRYIKITLKKLVDQIQVEITDNGAGIDPNNIDKVFDKFVSFPTIYDVRGTGIGLYLSHEVIKAHNGTISIASEGLGKGTCVTIMIPLQSI